MSICDLLATPGVRTCEFQEAALPSKIPCKQASLRPETSKDPTRAVGPFDVVPGEALAEDTRFETIFLEGGR
jgi:hypothetical protein